MKRLLSSATLVAIAFLSVVASSIPFSSDTMAASSQKKTTAPQGKVEKVHGQKGRGTGEDPNIKSDSETNDPSKTVPAPSTKGGEKSKGQGECAVFIDNRTSLFIKIYVDGIARGTVGPWGDSYCYTGAGRTQLYAVATFTDGSRITWGPSYVDCYLKFTWQLSD